jgi:glycopeptide antibiotics resistance protein
VQGIIQAWRDHGVTIVVSLVLSAAIEITQYALDVGRVSSVDDVLLNATGALLAGLASRRWWARADNPVTESGAAPVR